MDELAFEAALFDQPGGADFDAVVAAVDGVAFRLSGFSVGFGEIDIFKERTSGGFFAWVGEFVGANNGNDVANTGWADVDKVVIFEIIFDRIVEWALHLSGV